MEKLPHQQRMPNSYLYFPSLITAPTQTFSKSHSNCQNFSEETKNNAGRAKMASTLAVSMATPLTSAQKRLQRSEAFFRPLPVRPSRSMAAAPSKPKSSGSFVVHCSLKEKAVTGLTAAALTASMVIPQVAEAADSGLSPSLKNFLLSIVAGGVVLFVIVGAVVGVANFDPVKRS